jgi:hypothetical protein
MQRNGYISGSDICRRSPHRTHRATYKNALRELNQKRIKDDPEVKNQKKQCAGECPYCKKTTYEPLQAAHVGKSASDIIDEVLDENPNENNMVILDTHVRTKHRTIFIAVCCRKCNKQFEDVTMCTHSHETSSGRTWNSAGAQPLPLKHEPLTAAMHDDSSTSSFLVHEPRLNRPRGPLPAFNGMVAPAPVLGQRTSTRCIVDLTEDSDTEDEAADASTASPPWSCDRCTFVNAPRLVMCEMCDAVKVRGGRLGGGRHPTAVHTDRNSCIALD